MNTPVRARTKGELRRPLGRGRGAVALAAVLAAVLAGCGASPPPSSTQTVTVVTVPSVPSTGPVPQVVAPASAIARERCAATVAVTLQRIGARIYGRAAGGPNARDARSRLIHSRALAAAVARGSAAATAAALRPLLSHQVKRVLILGRGGQVLARVGSGPALAPVSGALRSVHGAVVGRYVFSVAYQSAIAGITGALSGARVVVGADGRGAPPAAGPGARVVSYPAQAFPRGALRMSMLIPPGALGTCGSTPAQTVANTVGAVAQRLVASESRGSTADRAVQHVAADPAFVAAVQRRDPAAVRRLIVTRYFHAHTLHIVRVRAVAADGRLIDDVGGPFVISPITAPVRAPGGPVGSVTLSVQDDTGYIKLMHDFTGAAVVLHKGPTLVPGSTLDVPLAAIPPQGAIDVGGRRLQVYSFTTVAFPSGPLHVALLLPLR